MEYSELYLYHRWAELKRRRMIFWTCLLFKTVGKAPTSEMTVVARDKKVPVWSGVKVCCIVRDNASVK